MLCRKQRQDSPTLPVQRVERTVKKPLHSPLLPASVVGPLRIQTAYFFSHCCLIACPIQCLLWKPPLPTPAKTYCLSASIPPVEQSLSRPALGQFSEIWTCSQLKTPNLQRQPRARGTWNHLRRLCSRLLSCFYCLCFMFSQEESIQPWSRGSCLCFQQFQHNYFKFHSSSKV